MYAPRTPRITRCNQNEIKPASFISSQAGLVVLLQFPAHIPVHCNWRNMGSDCVPYDPIECNGHCMLALRVFQIRLYTRSFLFVCLFFFYFPRILTLLYLPAFNMGLLLAPGECFFNTGLYTLLYSSRSTSDVETDL